MKPTLEQCYSQARSLLGDDDIIGGQLFTDSVLQPHATQAIRELFRVLRDAQDPFVLAEGYFVLPPNTNVFDPATAGLNSLPEPEYVEWAAVQPPGAVAITNVVMTTGAAPYATITAPGHGQGVGTFPFMAVYGVQGFDQFNSINQAWTMQAIDANTLQANGCTQVGSYTANTGFVVSISANNQFIPMAPRDRIEDSLVSPPSAADIDTIYAWEGGIFRFIPSAQARLIRITFRQSGVVDQSPSSTVPIDDCQDYIATRMAGLAGKTRGASQRGAELTMEAVGPTGAADGSGGILRQLLAANIRNMQRLQYRYKSFRARRNRPDFLLF